MACGKQKKVLINQNAWRSRTFSLSRKCIMLWPKMQGNLEPLRTCEFKKGWNKYWDEIGCGSRLWGCTSGAENCRGHWPQRFFYGQNAHSTEAWVKNYFDLVPGWLLQELGILSKEMSHPESSGEIRMKFTLKGQCSQELGKILNKGNHKNLTETSQSVPN